LNENNLRPDSLLTPHHVEMAAAGKSRFANSSIGCSICLFAAGRTLPVFAAQVSEVREAIKGRVQFALEVVSLV